MVSTNHRQELIPDPIVLRFTAQELQDLTELLEAGMSALDALSPQDPRYKWLGPDRIHDLRILGLGLVVEATRRRDDYWRFKDQLEVQKAATRPPSPGGRARAVPCPTPKAKVHPPKLHPSK